MNQGEEQNIEVPAEQEDAPEADAGAEAEGEGSYKIGDQSFKTSEEAFAYANSLVYKNAITEAEANAYRQAVADTSNGRAGAQNVTQNPPPLEENFEEKFYADPKQFLQEFEQKIMDRAEEKILGQVTQKSEDEKLWSDFFRQNPDLEDFREDCEYTLAKHTADIKAIVSTKGQKSGMDFLAQKTRAKFQTYIEKSKPTRALERTTSGPSTGSPVNVTRKPPQKQDLDFAAEIRSLRGKRA